jgi:hypothetical protein
MPESVRICVADFCPSGDWLGLMGMTILVVGLVMNYAPKLFPRWRRDHAANVQTLVICCDLLGLLLTAAGVTLLGLDNLVLVLGLAVLMVAALVVGLAALARVWRGPRLDMDRAVVRKRGPLELAAITARIVGGIGIVVLVIALATVWNTGWGISLFPPAATLIAAGLASYVALKSVVTWNEQRRRERDQTELKHREEIYEAIVTHMTMAFLSSLMSSRTDDERKAALVKDATQRSKAAVWADKSTISALARWQQLTHKISVEQGGEPRELKEPLMTCFYDVVVAMRQDLSGHATDMQPDREALLSTIFNDRPQTNDGPKDTREDQTSGTQTAESQL